MARFSSGQPATQLDKDLAKALGLKISEYSYKSFDEVNRTRFTSPPSFSTNKAWIPTLKDKARELGHELIDSDNPKEVAEDFLNKLTK